MEKEQLRRQLQQRLLEMNPEQRKTRSRKACRNLIGTNEFQNSSVVMIYLALPHEVDTSEAILHAWQLKKEICVPKISWQQRHMIPVRIHSLETYWSCMKDDKNKGIHNTQYPLADCLPVPFSEIDLVVAPALAYDRSGNRLGRGGSYYDRFFAHEQLDVDKCGFAFAEQLMDLVPIKEHDQPVDLLVTDEDVIYFKSNN